MIANLVLKSDLQSCFINDLFLILIGWRSVPVSTLTCNHKFLIVCNYVFVNAYHWARVRSDENGNCHFWQEITMERKRPEVFLRINILTFGYRVKI